jgi:hypothetical protein
VEVVHDGGKLNRSSAPAERLEMLGQRLSLIEISGDKGFLNLFHVKHQARHAKLKWHLLDAQEIPAAARAILLQFDLSGITGADREWIGGLFHVVVLGELRSPGICSFAQVALI